MNTNSMKSPGTLYAALWQAFVGQMQSMKETLERLTETEGTELGFEEEWSRCFRSCEVTYRNRLHKHAVAILGHLVERAATAFAPPGQKPLEIDESRYVSRYIDKDQVEIFNPEAVWDELEATYGGDKGKELGYQQLAASLSKHFDLKRGMPLNPKRGIVSLNVGVYLDGFNRKYGGKTELSYHSREQICKVSMNLADFLLWAGEHEGEVMCRKFANTWWNHGTQVESRRTTVMCDDLSVVEFQTRFEFRLSLKLIVKLQEFLGLYYWNIEQDQAA